ncbi:MAG: 1-deoxy-D-xylulose-5-phosphate synthase [Lachnospiraceae bacterium]|nr:1-deoxy-D-xylulose-5-phosphate synthase [Lachnospiraceae bacterium]
MVLEKINEVNDIKNLDAQELGILAEEIREFLIDKISVTGGHLASNLGVVELTMALHLNFELPADKIVWDVGHQAYTHKILTGRKTGFDELRKYGGMSGFPKRKESECDSFDTGHSSTSISAAMGLVNARDILGEKHHVVAVIGDGALTGGMAYEALNNASHLKKNFIIVLNDNKMSISENLGGMSKYLNNIRTADFYTGLKSGVENTLIHMGGQKVAAGLKRTKDGIKQFFVPGMLFENMGITYLGPVDGHDIEAMGRVFSEAKRVKGAVLVHVLTKKGKGYEPAEKNPSKFHGTDPFVIETGLPKKKKEKPNYTDVFSATLCRLSERDEKVVAITAAMPDGTGLKKFSNLYPKRFFDVGIAEEHAVTFAAGLAAGGLTPVVAVYSSFLQRAYDQIVHDVCIQNLHVVFAIDRAGLVGSDGETHQGIFDLSFMATIPNLCIMAPKNKQELYSMLKFALKYDGPIAIRYPRGQAYEGLEGFREKIVYGKAEMLYKEQDIAIMAVGSMVKVAEEVREILKEQGLNCTLINARFVKEFDKEMIQELAADHKLLVTMEENVTTGGFGERVMDYVHSNHIDLEVEKIALPDMYVEHGNVNILYKETRIDADTVAERIMDAVKA